MTEAPYASLADFAATFDPNGGTLPGWVHPDAAAQRVLDAVGMRNRLEDILDTVVALQRAEWLHDGVYAGPSAMPTVYRDVLHAARTLRIAVPPAILAGSTMRGQGCFGTDGRAFLYLSTYFFDPATEGERRFLAGRLCGHIAAHQVTAATLYALLVDHNGIRSLARKAVGPMLEIVLAPLSVGVRLALSRWHRAAEITADRAGLLCCGDLESAGRALLRISLGRTPDVDVATYLDQLKGSRASPGRWTELLADQPFTHKRLEALAAFARSEVWVRLTGQAVDDPMSRDALDKLTSRLLGVS
ncbi:MAG: M48 family metallopeptidase [Myxococcota bacterium]